MTPTKNHCASETRAADPHRTGHCHRCQSAKVEGRHNEGVILICSNADHRLLELLIEAEAET